MSTSGAARSLTPALIGLAVAGLAFGAALAEGAYTDPYTVSGFLDLFVGWSFIGVGLYAWWRRPSNRIGQLMTATGFLWFIGFMGLDADPTVFTISSIVGVLYHATTIHLLLAFPSGRLEDPAARLAALTGYAVFFGGNVLIWLVADIGAEFDCPTCPENVLQVVHDDTLADLVIAVTNGTAAVLVAYVLVRLVAGWLGSDGWRRRALTPLVFSGAATAFLLGLTLLTLSFGLSVVQEDVFIAATAAFAAVPYAFLLALARTTRLSGGAIGDLVARLTGAHSSGEARAALRTALGDPTLDLAFRLPAGGEYSNPEGRIVEPAAPREGRTHTLVEVDGRPVAAMMYDASLADEPQLVDAVVTSAALAIEKHQLDAELRAKVEELRASRERIVAAGFEERRRIERNLHDGAQQRFVSLALSLRLARARLDSDPAAAGELLDSAAQELQLGLSELRDLARGIHPAVLSERGLEAAIAALAARTPFEVEFAGTPPGRLPEKVETAAYFVVSEALANTTKHAKASRASVRVTCADSTLIVEVADDGIGGAETALGSGLRGLRDRLAALDGRLEIDSRPGRGTTLRASIPCGGPG